MEYITKKNYCTEKLFSSKEQNLTDEIKCCICLDVFDNPMTFPQCGHTYCMPCIHNSVHSNIASRCPQCRAPITADSLVSKLDIHLLIDNIQIFCPSKLVDYDDDEKEGQLNFVNKRQRVMFVVDRCTWMGTIKAAKDHETNCAFSKIQCGNIGCGKVFQRMDATNHKAICPYQVIQCQHCEKQLSRYEKADHEPCMYENLFCPNSCKDDTGKTTTIIRHNLLSHLSICRLEPIHCSYQHTGCQEILPRHLMEIHSTNVSTHIDGLLATISSLKSNEIKARNEVKDLRIQLQNLQRRDQIQTNIGDIIFPVSLEVIRKSNPAIYHRMKSPVKNIGGINFTVEIKFHSTDRSFALALRLTDGITRFGTEFKIEVEYKTVVLSNNGTIDFELHELCQRTFIFDDNEFVHTLTFDDIEKARYITDGKYTFKTSIRLLDFIDEHVTYL